MSDISTEDAIKRAVRDEATAGLVAGMVTITHKQQQKIGFLEGIIVAMLFFSGWAFYEVSERVAVNEIRINRVEAKVDL